MENGKRKVKNEERESAGRKLSTVPLSVQKICSACGAVPQRKLAKFCLVCGKLLLEDYQPLDAFRSAHRLQGKSLKFEEIKAQEKLEDKNLFERDENNAAHLAWAFVVYSMVPYLGILFCPGAFLMSGIGLFIAHRRPYLGGQKMSVYSLALSFIILAIQILLWWLLYIIPQLNRP